MPCFPAMCSWNLGLLQLLNTLESISFGQLQSDHAAVNERKPKANSEAGKQQGSLFEPGSPLHPMYSTPLQSIRLKVGFWEGYAICPGWFFHAKAPCFRGVYLCSFEHMDWKPLYASLENRWSAKQELIPAVHKLLLGWCQQHMAVLKCFLKKYLWQQGLEISQGCEISSCPNTILRRSINIGN